MLAQTAIKKCLWTEKKYDSCKIEKNLSNNTKESATQFSQINLVHQVNLDKTWNKFPMVKTVVANGRSLKEWVNITKLDSSLHFSINNHSNPFWIIWKGNLIAVNKSFGTKKCTLCMKEQTEILKASYSEKCTLINNNSEIYGSCRHKRRFHRLTRNNTGTDESDNR